MKSEEIKAMIEEKKYDTQMIKTEYRDKEKNGMLSITDRLDRIEKILKIGGE